MTGILPILQKPTFGSACNGCGYCCKEQACWISENLLQSTVAPCIALETDGERYFCGMVRNPSHYLQLKFDGNAMLQPMIFAALGVGKGCDSDD